MTTGTKIFLALFALIVSILVVYYGLVVPERGSTTTTTGDAQSQVADNENEGGERSDGSTAHAGGRDASAERPATLAGAGERFDPQPPPPRQPGSVMPMANLQPPLVAGPADGLLSEGLREASGETESSPGAQPLLGDAATTRRPPSSFLPLIGLNAGDAISAQADSSGRDQPVAPQTPAEASTTSSSGTAPESSPTSPSGKPSPSSTSGAAGGQTPPRRFDAAGTNATTPHRPQPRVEYIISEGDTYSSIAEEWFGDRSKWTLIARENPTIDPMRLKIGQRIHLPPKEAALAAAGAASPSATEPVPNEGELIYTVQSGDTLSSIARDHYGDPAKWQDIYDRNRDTIGRDPGALRVGMKLRLMMKRG